MTDPHDGISRRALVTGMAGAGAATALGVTIARAQSATPGAGSPAPSTGMMGGGQQTKDLYTDFVGKLAVNLGNLDVDTVDTAIRTTLKQMVDEAQQDGLIGADEATTIKERIDSGDFPGGMPGMFERRMDRGMMRPGRGREARKTPRQPAGFDRMGELDLGGVAEFLGISRADLIQELGQGKSLAEVAEAHGKSRDDLKAFLVSQATDEIDTLIDATRGGNKKNRKSTSPGSTVTPAATPAT